ncbi:MAG TPA: PHB depolymerase family esterase [Chloroflexota bacterium]
MPDHVVTLECGGRSRTALVHVPDERPAGLRPLLLVLHGRQITGADIRRWTRFDAVADQHGFLVAYPEGYQRSWNDGRGNSPAEQDGVDDVAFIGALLDHLIRAFPIAAAQVAVTGLSNGGVLCHRLALELSERIAVIAPVAGTMPLPLASVQPACAVSVLVIHGTADRSMRFDGRPSGLWSRLQKRLFMRRYRPGQPMLSVPATLARWRTINRCAADEPLPSLPASATDHTWVERRGSGGQGGTTVESWIIHGGGHTWPGGPAMPPLGRVSRQFDAAQVIWEFAARHWVAAAARRLPVG